jgi:hypothetical protein
MGTARSVSSIKIIITVVGELGFLRCTIGQIMIAAAIIDGTIVDARSDGSFERGPGNGRGEPRQGESPVARLPLRGVRHDRKQNERQRGRQDRTRASESQAHALESDQLLEVGYRQRLP